MKKLLIFFAVVGLLGASTAYAGTADVVFLVDESGSMSTEHGWIGTMVTTLDSALVGAGVTGNQYALLGYGGGGTLVNPHKHAVGGGDWGTATELSTATGGLTLSGGFEDGWRAIDYALNNYTFRSGAAVNFILVTDEDRDNGDASLTFTGLEAALDAEGVILNVVVDYIFKTSGNVTALGEADNGTAYLADGSGGFTTATGATSTLGGERQFYNVNNKSAYIDLAWATGGAGWDLQQLRAGGNTATSFTAAFVDHKVEEIIITFIPLPAAAWMGLALLGGLGVARRFRRR